jgi:anti-sigma-K factor RskA
MTGKPEERHAQLELCIPYVFGRLNPGNRKQFEAHLATGCEQCKRELSGLYEATALLPLLLRQESPPTGLRQRLLSRISSKKPEPPRSERVTPQREKVETPASPRGHHWYLYTSLVVGGLLIIALVIFVNELVGTTGTQEKQIADMRNELQQKQEVLGVLQAERLEALPLTSVGPGSSAYGKILWNPAKRSAVLQVANLPVEPEGSQYQLWILKEKKYLSAGVFDVAREKENVLKVMALPVGEIKEIEGFTITLEPKGGGLQPAGTVQLRGSTR